MIITFKKNTNVYSKTLLVIFKLHIFAGFEFGFFQHRSSYKSFLLKYGVLLLGATYATIVLYSSSFIYSKISKIFQAIYTAAYVSCVIVYAKINLRTPNNTLCNFRKDLENIDVKLRNYTSNTCTDKKAIMAMFFFFIIRLIRCFLFCAKPENSCQLSLITIYYLMSFTVESISVINAYIFYSIYCRLSIMTSKIDSDCSGIDQYTQLYKSVADITKKYKCIYEPLSFMTILFMVPSAMVSIYGMLAEVTAKSHVTTLLTFVTRMLPAIMSLIIILAPALYADMVTSQVKKIVNVLSNKILLEKNPRVEDWLFMTSPWPLAAIIAIYLTLVKLILPAYMKDRRPRDLRTVIKWYNVVQIAANAVVTWGIMTSGWTTTYHFGCMLPDYSMNPEALRMLRFLWWTVVLKLLELFETIFFVLRKKQRQVSFLHVWHHVSTLIMIWSGVKYVGGGITSFSPMINNAVHVIMYSYYLLSAEGSPGVKAFLKKYKLWLTALQMVQFTIMLIYSLQVYLPSCPAPHGVATMYFPNVIFVYYMFYDFFKENYRKKSENSNGVKSK